MPFRICKTFKIENGHALSKHPGNCRFPHGHSRSIEIVLVADDLDSRDMVCDFKALKASLHAFLDTWDHAMSLNTSDPQFAFFQQCYGERIVPFPDCDPTSEAMARTIFQETGRRLRETSARRDAAFPIRPHVRVERVRVTETSSSWAEYFE